MLNRPTTYQNSGDYRTAKKYIGNYGDTFDDFLRASEMLAEGKLIYWNELQRTYFEKRIVLQEFIATTEEAEYWRMFFNLQERDIELGSVRRKGKAVSPEGINIQLWKCYSDRDQEAGERFWNKLEKQTDIRGYYVPIADITRLSRQTLKDTLAWRTLLSNHIDIVGFLRSLKTAQSDYWDIDLPILGVWTYLKVYASALNQIYETQGDLQSESILWISDNIEQLADRNLPSAEVVQLLFSLVEERFRLKDGSSQISSRWTRYSDLTQQFYSVYKEVIEEFINSNSAVYEASAYPILKEAFLDLCSSDRDYMMVQEILDDRSGEQLIKGMPARFQEIFGSARKKSMGERLRNVIGGMSIVERIKGISDTETAVALPNFQPEPLELIASDVDKWYEYSPEELIEIKRSIRESLDGFRSNRLSDIANERVLLHLQNLANTVTAPTVIWIASDRKVLPQLNTLSDERATQYAKFFWEKQQREEEDQALIDQLSLKLKEFEYPSEIDRFVKNAPTFSLYYMTEKWQVIWKDYRQTLSNRLKFRSGRMREFGILSVGESVDRRKDIWLNEMLKIEEEIKPYIGFVKKAFAAALPVRQKVDFDPYRHRPDGVEFDPETILDQNKWLRGDIMKSLRFETTVGKIEQVNSFCLDFSGSMDHGRMRGLFKILYLLVLGLEDRKTYDAIHFFGTSFISTSPFRNGYTDRSVLFNILRKIGQIEKNEVRYRGIGGTNISEGLRMCHMEIENFSNHLISQNPNINLATSLFVLTDGEPTVGITDNEKLSYFIEDLRKESKVIIKGIYLNPENQSSGFVKAIFGNDHYIESHSFEDAVNAFVSVMTQTYKKQRKEYRWEQKKRKIEGIKK